MSTLIYENSKLRQISWDDKFSLVVENGKEIGFTLLAPLLLLFLPIKFPLRILCFFFAFFVVIGIYYFFYRRQHKKYKIYENQVEMYNFLNKKEIINFDDIYEVRYQDNYELESHILLHLFTPSIIYLNLIDDHPLGKHIILTVNDGDRTDKILHHFKSRNIDVKLITKNKTINQSLGIANWDRS